MDCREGRGRAHHLVLFTLLTGVLLSSHMISADITYAHHHTVDVITNSHLNDITVAQELRILYLCIIPLCLHNLSLNWTLPNASFVQTNIKILVCRYDKHKRKMLKAPNFPLLFQYFFNWDYEISQLEIKPKCTWSWQDLLYHFFSHN